MGSGRGAGVRHRGLVRATILFVVFSCAFMAAPTALAAVYTVNRSDDIDHGVCDAVTGCTLRDAINAANSTAGADYIAFQIGIGGSYTISPASALPQITDTVT